MALENYKIGLLIRSGPVAGRFSREQLDIALSAASLGYELELFFQGAGVMQLAAENESDDHLGGHKGWKALPGLSEVTAWMSEKSLSELRESGIKLMLDVEIAEPADMADRLARCNQAMVI